MNMSKTPLSRSSIRGHLLFASVLFGTAFSTLALTRIAPALTNAAWSANQFQFTLLGETNVAYVLESSSDLQTWVPALTNSDSQATRNITVPALTPWIFWRVRPVPGPLFEYAILAQGTVRLNGSGRIDSFNSTNDLESTLGQYDTAKATDRAVVATTLRTFSAVDVGTTVIYGFVATGPGGTVRVAPSGSVGSKAFVESVLGKGLVEPGHHINDINYSIPPATLPNNFGPAVVLPQNVLYPPAEGGTNFTFAVLADGDYRHIGNLSIGIGQKMLINARCRIHVSGNTTLASGGYILIGPDAYVEWYGGSRVDLQGQGVINQTGSARNFSIIALTSQPVSYGAQARLIGTIYAPRSAVSLVGYTDAIGAIVCTNFSLSGTMGLHFDESLKSTGPFR